MLSHSHALAATVAATDALLELKRELPDATWLHPALIRALCETGCPDAAGKHIESLLPQTDALPSRLQLLREDAEARGFGRHVERIDAALAGNRALPDQRLPSMLSSR